jgi:hypothetical protein
MPRLSISIVTYKPKLDILRATLESVLRSDVDLRLYLVDNSPTDDYRLHLPPDPRIEYIHRPENPGFGKGHNTAIKQSVSGFDYHLVLNPDVYFQPSILAGMLEYMDTHISVGMASPKVFYPDGRLQLLCKLLPSPADVLLRRLLPNGSWTRRRNAQYELQELAYDQISLVPNLSGCFMLIRRSVLKTIGGFDERFFMYFEDIDLTRQITRISRTLFLPQFQIYHHYGKGSYHSIHLLRIHIQSAVKYFNKWGWIFDHERRVINKKTLNQFDLTTQTMPN